MELDCILVNSGLWSLLGFVFGLLMGILLVMLGMDKKKQEDERWKN